jgi:hypothetical protein
MAKRWRTISESVRWRHEKQRAEMIAAEIKRGTARSQDIEWLKAWKQRQEQHPSAPDRAGALRGQDVGSADGP